MTVPDSSTSTSAPATPQVIDGKYEVLRELSQEGNLHMYEVKAAEGVIRRVAWFDVTTPADRQQFHAYRTAIRAIAPAGLTDVVARPGAYYAVWQDVSGQPFQDYLTQSAKRVKSQEEVQAVQNLTTALAASGFALSDADIVMNGQLPQVTYLRPLRTSRTPEQIAVLNSAALSALSGGKIKAPRRPLDRLAWLSFVPGLLFLAGAGRFGAQAAQIYLNPPVTQIKAVTGRPAREAAQILVKAGYRVEYNYGDSSAVNVGSVIRQEPPAGTQLPVGRLITLTVNKPEPLTVPKIEDMTLEQAKSPLKDNVLKLGKISKVDGTLTNTPEGRIIAQVPVPGATTQRGLPIQVLVSTGIKGKGTWIALLEGLTYDQAREHVRAAGLVLTDVIKEPSDRPENTVLRQSPAPFVRVTVGSPVQLVIATAKYTPPSTPAGSLPVPPPYVPPPPPIEPAPSTGQTSPATDQATVTDQTAATDQSTAAAPTPDATRPDATGAAPPTETTNEARTVTFSYVFPADLPSGNYTVVVQDADGEREVLPETDSARLAGFQASAPTNVRGNAVFIIRANGAEYARVNPQ
ncbi:PASTA domain-containing protein [Deinococcus sp.]|uniref:PASTA domain-containing protein n=1 Tax=Deinococcus sp. TaxID=47478 RepID=UPI0025B9721B|nr:PASTA domain-containing protein [Deinococcus sp.]